ncbi:MAG: hypothetical protein H7A21_05120 [Spirochaetales bacterium]|nr:hypothetical protein [Leptospiraceae bacterium]MCP5480795.1 hypothetical protein [Spirochaetales bacterium]
MRTTIDIPDELFREIKARAALEGTTLKEYVVSRLRHGLEHHGGSKAESDRWQAWLKNWQQSARALQRETKTGRNKKGRSAGAMLRAERNAR